MRYETDWDRVQGETDRLAFLLSCYDVWSAGRTACAESYSEDRREDGA